MENRLNADQHRRQVAGSFRGHHSVRMSLLFCGTGIAEPTSNFLLLPMPKIAAFGAEDVDPQKDLLMASREEGAVA